MRLLCTGDIHLGRNPTRIPADRAPDQRLFTTRAIWERIVNLAIDERVDALLISGDLVDHDNRFFEALGPVEDGVKRLVDADIPIFAVAGNHDYDVLPALADRYGEKFRLVGRNQRWERVALTDETGRPRLFIDGWSFAAPYVRNPPLADYRPEPADGVPVIGLLHTDLDQTVSAYAPSRLDDLRAAPVSAWLIGHVHAPAHHQATGARSVLYPGSPQPLDPGEPGAHGVWFLDIEGSGRAEFSFRPLASVRYQRLRVDITGALDVSEAGQRVFDRVNSDANDLLRAAFGASPELILYRVELTGRTPLGASRTTEFETFRQQSTDLWAIETILDSTRPAIDLDRFAGESSPAGAAARLLQALERAEAPPTLAKAHAVIETVVTGPHYRSLEEEAPPTREIVADVTWELLEALVASRSGEA